MNDDPNNPWSLTSSYNQVEDGEVTPNTTLVQKPDMNTNMFTSYATSIFATYLFLIDIIYFTLLNNFNSKFIYRVVRKILFIASH